jgi:hypothetical protein
LSGSARGGVDPIVSLASGDIEKDRFSSVPMELGVASGSARDDHTGELAAEKLTSRLPAG